MLELVRYSPPALASPHDFDGLLLFAFALKFHFFVSSFAHALAYFFFLVIDIPRITDVPPSLN